MITQHLKQIKKRADINNSVKVDLSSTIQYAEKLISVLRETAKSAVSQVSLATGIIYTNYYIFKVLDTLLSLKSFSMYFI